MKFSILICTRNSQRLIKQNCYGDILEVIIVDFKSHDFTLPISRTTLAEGNMDLIEVACEDSGKSPALTLGLDVARGDYIVTVDDDNILFPNFMCEAKIILNTNKIGCVGARGIIDEALMPPSWFLVYQGAYAIGTPPQGKHTDWVWGAGSIISKDAWNKLRNHGFKLVLNPARESQSAPIAIGGEDVELSLAIKLIGFEIVISENLKFIHKFEQSRLAENYLIKNSLGVSKSVPIHDIYRLVMYRPNVYFPILFWYYGILRKIVGCCIRIVRHFVTKNSFNRKFNQAILYGIFQGFIVFRGQFSNIHKKLLELKRMTSERR